MSRAHPIALAALALVALLCVRHGRAQDDVLVLRTGFVPDPLIVEGETRGETPASSLGDSACVGFVPARPSHTLEVETRIGFLRLFATSTENLVLVVRTATGEVLCNDDRFAEHPSVEGVLAPGPVEIFVGTHDPGASARYSLFLTETRSVRPGVGRDVGMEATAVLGGDMGLLVEASEGQYGDVRLRRGFIPDPRVLRGTGGGLIAADLLGGTCHGRLPAAPAHVMTLRDDFDFLQLYVRRGHVPAEQGPIDGPPEPGTPGSELDPAEISLVVLTPEGRFLCDSRRDLASIAADAWPAGEYRVWVGYEREGIEVPYRIGISEIRRVR